MATLRTSAIGAASSSATGSSTIAVPADAVAGDVARIIVAITAPTATLDAITGWNVRSGPILITGDAAAYVLTRTLVAEDIGATVNLVFSGGTGRITSQMDVFADATETGILVATPVVDDSGNTTATIPTLDNVPAGAVFDVAFVGRVSSGVPPDFTPPTGYSQGVNNRHETTSGSSNLSTEGMHKIVSTAGTYGGEVATQTSGKNLAFAFAIPASSGGATPVVADFTATPTSGTVPFTVAFNASESGGTPPYTWAWDYGDGTTGTASSPNHEYTTAGTYTVSVTVTDSLGASDTETKASLITASAPSSGGGGGVGPGEGSKAPITRTQALARTVVAPTGTILTRWADNSPAANTTYDFRGVYHRGYFLHDARMGYGQFADGSGGTNATEHELNLKPIAIGETTPATGVYVVGGKVDGTQARTYTWNSHKHGTPCQADLDAGIDPATVWATWAGTNSDGDARWRVAEGSWVVINGFRSDNTHDGVGFYTQNDAITDTGQIFLENSWINFCHDDAIENDRAYLTLDVYDCLFERIMGFLSVAGPTGSPGTGKTQTIRNSIIWLEKKPGPYQSKSDVWAHGAWYKDRDNSPPLVMQDCILACDGFRTNSQAALPETAGSSYSNVTIVWLGSANVADYPGNIPTGVTVTTDRTILDNAVADWKYRHGVTDWQTVDNDLMSAPRASSTDTGGGTGGDTGTLPEGTLPGTPIDGVPIEAHNHVPVYADANGNLYTVAEEYGPAGEVPNHNSPKMFKSTDGGSTWTEMDGANRPTDNDLESGYLLQHGTSLFFIFSDGNFVSFNEFRTSDDATTPDKWVIKDERGIGSIGAPSELLTYAVRLSDGRFRVSFADAGPNVSYITRAAGGGWSAKTTMGAGRGAVLVRGANDVTHVLYHDYVNKQILYRTISSAGTLSNAVRVDTAGTNTDSRNYNPLSNAIYFDNAGQEVISALYAATNGLRLIQIVNGVASDTLVDSSVPIISPANSDKNTGNDGPICHLAVDGTTLYAAYAVAMAASDGDGDVLVRSLPHGGTWTAREVFWDAPATGRAHWVYNNVITRGSQTLHAVLYDVGPHLDNEGNLTYNRTVLRTTSATPPSGSATGSRTYTGSATGKRVAKGSAAGNIAYQGGGATGYRAPKGSATGARTYEGTAQGVSPTAGVTKGTATGARTYTGFAIGKRVAKGTASGGLVTYVGTAQGGAIHKGEAAGAFVYTGSAIGERPGGYPAQIIGTTFAVFINDGVVQASFDSSPAWTGTFVHDGVTAGSFN